MTSTPPLGKDHEFVAMAGEAFRGQWVIPPGEFATLPQRLIAISRGEDVRSAIKASKLLVDMNSQNDKATDGEQYGKVVVYIPDNGRGPKPGEYLLPDGGGVVITPNNEAGVTNGQP